MPPAVTARTRPHAGLVPALLLLLAGLFAMHGLSGHGVESVTDAGAPAPMAAMAEPGAGMPADLPSPHTGHAAVTPPDSTSGGAPAVAPQAPAPAATRVVAPAERHAGMPMAGACVAMLGGLVLVLSAARRTPVRIPVPVLLAVPGSGRTERDRDPPSLTELSVRRC